MGAPCSLLLLLVTGLLCTIPTQVECCEFGDGCRFPCHCKDDAACDPDTGDCPNGCADGHPVGWGWGGPGCQVGNIAFGKTASQSRTRGGDEENNAARFAVDGDLNQDFPGGSARCAWAYLDSQAWWTVIFEDRYVIYNVSLHNSNHGTDYLDRTFVEYQIDDGAPFSRIGEIHAPTNSRVDVETFQGPTHTSVNTLRLVRMNLGGASDLNLVVCEVVVCGYLYRECAEGKYGPGCLLSCNCNGECRDVDGYCPFGCTAGKMGDDCQEDCPGGTWGLDCHGRCQCSEEDEECTLVEGVCLTSGCPAGQIGGGCTLVARKYFLTIDVLETTSESVLLEIFNVGTTEVGQQLDIHNIQVSTEHATTWNNAGQLEDVADGRYMYTVENLQPGEEYIFRVLPGCILDGVEYYGFPSPSTPPIVTPASGGSLVAIIAGSVVGGLLIIVIIVTIIIICWRKSSKKPEEDASNENQVNTVATDVAGPVYEEIRGDRQEEDQYYLTPVKSEQGDGEDGRQPTSTASAHPVKSSSSDTVPALTDKSPVQPKTTDPALYENQSQMYVNTSFTDLPT